MGWQARPGSAIRPCRVDGAGASHDLVGHLLGLSSPQRIMRFTCGWTIREEDEQAIRMLPADAWKPGTAQDGSIGEDKDAAEITRLMSWAENWPGGLRWIVRRVKPSRRQPAKLTPLREGGRLAVLHHLHEHPRRRPRGVPGSHHPQFIDMLHREHACVETTGVRTAKDMGLRGLPSKMFQVNEGWGLAANIAADLAAWTRLLGCTDDDELRDTNPPTLRYRIWQLPARHARKRVLAISQNWPWAQEFPAC